MGEEDEDDDKDGLNVIEEESHSVDQDNIITTQRKSIEDETNLNKSIDKNNNKDE